MAIAKVSHRKYLRHTLMDFPSVRLVSFGIITLGHPFIPFRPSVSAAFSTINAVDELFWRR